MKYTGLSYWNIDFVVPGKSRTSSIEEEVRRGFHSYGLDGGKWGWMGVDGDGRRVLSASGATRLELHEQAVLCVSLSAGAAARRPNAQFYKLWR